VRCPRCGGTKIYQRRKPSKAHQFNICVNSKCKHHFSEKSSIPYLHAGKKPIEWYSKIIDLWLSGLKPSQIARELGMKYSDRPKSVYLVLHRFRAFLAATID